MKTFCTMVTILFLSFGATGIYQQFRGELPSAPVQISVNENLAYSLIFIGIGIWGVGSIAVQYVKEKLL